MITEPIGLYIHVPFCKSKCNYCDFLSFPCAVSRYEQDYVDALIGEISSYRQAPKLRVDTVFFGGGTPTLLSEKSFVKIFAAINEAFLLLSNTEITVESNPKTLNEQKLRILKELGVNRVSMGLQSVHENELRELGRIHSFDDFLSSYEICEKLGVTNINIDLMYGIPHQTYASFAETLRRVSAFSPKHISVYGLMLEEGTPFFAKKDSLVLPSEDEECEMYYLAADFLRGVGYRHYEISNSAKEGYECRHNLKYWHDQEYIGLGLAAHSYFGKKRYSNVSSFEEYFSPEMAKYRQETTLTEADEAYEFAMMRLRLAEGFSLSEYEARFSRSFLFGREDFIQKLQSAELLSLENGRINLTEKGFYVSNSILSELL